MIEKMSANLSLTQLVAVPVAPFDSVEDCAATTCGSWFSRSSALAVPAILMSALVTDVTGATAFRLGDAIRVPVTMMVSLDSVVDLAVEGRAVTASPAGACCARAGCAAKAKPSATVATPAFSVFKYGMIRKSLIAAVFSAWSIPG